MLKPCEIPPFCEMFAMWNTHDLIMMVCEATFCEEMPDESWYNAKYYPEGYFNVSCNSVRFLMQEIELFCKNVSSYDNLSSRIPWSFTQWHSMAKYPIRFCKGIYQGFTYCNSGMFPLQEIRWGPNRVLDLSVKPSVNFHPQKFCKEIPR